MKVQIPTNNERFLKDYLNAINGILKMTQTEINVCATLLGLDINNPCSKDNRMKAAKQLNWSRAVLNNSIKSLKIRMFCCMMLARKYVTRFIH